MSNQLNPFDKFQSLKKIDITNIEELKKMYEELLLTDISTKEKILDFQKQRDLIEKYFVNEMAECYFLKTTDVADEKRKKRMSHFDQNISPLVREYSDKLNSKFLNSPTSKELGEGFDLLRRYQINEKEIFNESNIELNKRIDMLSMEISEIQGKLTANWQGNNVPLPELYPYLKSTKRELRKAASDSLGASELSVCEVIDDKFDELLELRNKLASNAGYKSYTEYRFKELRRFDWGESDCFEFHKAVKKHILPLKRELLKLREKNLKLDKVMYFDTSVDIFGREPLRIYELGKSEEMVKGTAKIIKAIDEELYSYFCRIRDNNLLDLDTRENKAPGGYMVMYPIFEQASVFYNGAGLASDLMVLLHELGHCFHYFLGKDIEPYALQEWTSEVAEGGSMSMEYIGLEEAHHYLDEKSVERLKFDKLMSVIGLFSSCSMGDEFQHWLYANPGHDRNMRREKWKELSRIYNEGIDYDGKEDEFAQTGWQFSHILSMPFYFIDYSISELLALSIWDRYKKDKKDGIAKYKKGCSVGASKTVSETYEIFGTKLSFGDDVIGPLAQRLKNELNF